MKIKTIYITNDGKEFTSSAEAARHEEILGDAPEKRLRDNLSIYLSNKSKLKGGILYYDLEALNKAWKVWVSVRPKSKFAAYPARCEDANVALRDLETAATRYHCHLRDLKLAKEMIARINTTLRDSIDQKPLSDDLLLKAKPVQAW